MSTPHDADVVLTWIAVTRVLQVQLVFAAACFLRLWCSVKFTRRNSVAVHSNSRGSFTNPYSSQSEALAKFPKCGAAKNRWYSTTFGLGRLTRSGQPRRDPFFVPVPMSIRHLGKITMLSAFGMVAPVIFGLYGAVLAALCMSCVVSVALLELYFRRWTWHLGAETTDTMLKLENACIVCLISPVSLPLATVNCILHICKWTGARIARARWYQCTRVDTMPLCAALCFAAYSGWIGPKVVCASVGINVLTIAFWMKRAFNLPIQDVARYLLRLIRKMGGKWGHAYVTYALVAKAKKLHRTEHVTRRVPLSGFRPGMARVFGAIACVVSTVMIRATRQAEVDVATLLEDDSGWLLLVVGVAFIVILGRMNFFQHSTGADPPPYFFLYPFTLSLTVDDTKITSALKEAVTEICESELGNPSSGGLHSAAFKMALDTHVRNLGTHGRKQLRRRIAAWVHSVMAHFVTPSNRMEVPHSLLRGWAETRLVKLECWVLANLLLDRGIDLGISGAPVGWYDDGHVVWATEWEVEKAKDRECTWPSDRVFRAHCVQRLLQWKKGGHSGDQGFQRQKKLEGCTLFPSGSTPVSKDDVKALSNALIDAAMKFKATEKGDSKRWEIESLVREYLQVDNMRLHAPNACPYRRRK